jgi:glycosyltransferase involved in cell wall biosynthesis
VKVSYYTKYSDQGPSSRYRVFQFLELFQNQGVDLNIQMLFDDSYFEFLRSAPSIGRTIRKSGYVASRFKERRKALLGNHANLTVVEQQLFPYLPYTIERHFLPSGYLLEMDDAIYLTHPKKIPELVRNASAVLVGNRTLAEFAGRFNKNIHVIPTVLNTDVFQPSKKSAAEKIRIGWSGLEYNFKYLYKLRSVFSNLIATYQVEFVILSGSAPRNLEFPFRFIKWDAKHEVDQINQFDIGLMPLEMDEWSRSKCGMKLLQYMALEIPSVATPAGVNAEIIREGENGFTAQTEEEWTKQISLLIEDPQLRTKMGKLARKTVIEQYSVNTWFPKLLEVYRKYAQ